jgi:hypothetical protein
MPAYAGAVSIYSSGQPPPGAVDLGVVEVHAVQEEGTVEELLPQFVRKVASIGGNVAVVDGIRARFELVGRSHVETFYYTCGLGATCAGTRVYAANDELMIVSIFGRAMTTQLAPPPQGREAPLVPPAPPQQPPAQSPEGPGERAPRPAPPLEQLPSTPPTPMPRGADPGGPS